MSKTTMESALQAPDLFGKPSGALYKASDKASIPALVSACHYEAVTLTEEVFNHGEQMWARFTRDGITVTMLPTTQPAAIRDAYMAMIESGTKGQIGPKLATTDTNFTHPTSADTALKFQTFRFTLPDDARVSIAVLQARNALLHRYAMYGCSALTFSIRNFTFEVRDLSDTQVLYDAYRRNLSVTDHPVRIYWNGNVRIV